MGNEGGDEKPVVRGREARGGSVQGFSRLRGTNREALAIKALFLVVVCAAWQYFASKKEGFALIPPLSAVLAALRAGVASGEILRHVWFSLYLIGVGLAIGLAGAFIFTILYKISRRVSYVIDITISILDPLPGIALLPVIMILVGLGPMAIIVVIVHSIIWPVIINTIAGFNSVSRTQVELGRNLGLSEARLVAVIMIPNAFPHILSGFKIAWSRAWRALVSAEMVFGATGLQGGIGWYIYKKRYLMEMPEVFAGLLVIVIIGILVDEILFKTIDRKTVVKWGVSK
jgi:NitT/TauT family transport system permease protein